MALGHSSTKGKVGNKLMVGSPYNTATTAKRVGVLNLTSDFPLGARGPYHLTLYFLSLSRLIVGIFCPAYHQHQGYHMSTSSPDFQTLTMTSAFQDLTISANPRSSSITIVCSPPSRLSDGVIGHTSVARFVFAILVKAACRVVEGLSGRRRNSQM
ncbi:hypothetical protein IG631_14617 [Alternaria alternata]|nr:hypothetical protein IG631_14617 [Alternaria alternata]